MHKCIKLLRTVFLSALVGLACSTALATMAGASGADTRYFYAEEVNREYADAAAARRPTFPERVGEVTARWRFLVQCYRAVATDPAARADFTRNRLVVQGGEFLDHRDILRAFAARGITAAAITGQPTAVYTLQLVAYRQPAHVRRFLAGLSNLQGTYDPMTQIYGQTPKDFRLGYGDESLAYKVDPVYLITARSVTRIRYGIYENSTDAARDAAVWRARYHVTPYITRIPFTRTLTRRVLWGDLPGIYAGRRYLRRER